jgi:hypothetical protein
MKRSRIPKHFALLLAAAFLAGSALASEWSDKYNRFQPVRGERDWIIRNFDFYSQLQRNFEEAQHDARSFDLIEDYTSGIVLPSCGAAVRLLSRGHDMELMSAYFRLLTFTRNDASETFGYRLAQIFAANPALVEDAYKMATDKEKRVVIAELSWGFGNLAYGRKPSKKFTRLGERLARMKRHKG